MRSLKQDPAFSEDFAELVARVLRKKTMRASQSWFLNKVLRRRRSS